MFNFRLSMPPSANRYWRVGRDGKPHVSKEAQAYKETAGWEARAAGVELLHGHIKLTLIVFGLTEKADLSNRVKILEDALNGICWDDDNQLAELHVYREFDVVDEPYVDVYVEEV